MKKISIPFILICIYSVLLLNVNLYSLEPEKKEDLFKKAVKYFYQKKYEMAELLFQEELKKSPENQKAYSYLGDIFLYKKRYDGALRLYQKALDINPNNPENFFRIGQIYYYKKDGTKAIQNFEKSFSLNPEMKYSYYHIGLTYLILMRDKENTINNWQKFIDIAPEDPQHEKIRRAIELLRDPDFKIPSPDSEISIEEALHLGGSVFQGVNRKAKDKKAGHEKKKTKNKLEDIYRDDDM